MKKKFALIGSAGFVAPRHLKAIKDNDGELVASCDLNDSVGIIDSYFPDSFFFNNFNSFENFISKQTKKNKIDYLVVCSPNYLHHSHIRFGLMNEMDVICEKPLVINVELLENLFTLENKKKKKIYCILQLRINEEIYNLRKSLKDNIFYECELNYNTPRGKWYDYSWKGNSEKSGGILYNIGIHLFDILIWIFGECLNFEIHMNEIRNATGILFFKNAKVKWNLSLDRLHKNSVESERKLIINNKAYELTGKFSDSHSICYQEILSKNNIFHAKSTVESLLLVSKMSKI